MGTRCPPPPPRLQASRSTSSSARGAASRRTSAGAESSATSAQFESTNGKLAFARARRRHGLDSEPATSAHDPSSPHGLPYESAGRVAAIGASRKATPRRGCRPCRVGILFGLQAGQPQVSMARRRPRRSCLAAASEQGGRAPTRRASAPYSRVLGDVRDSRLGLRARTSSPSLASQRACLALCTRAYRERTPPTGYPSCRGACGRAPRARLDGSWAPAAPSAPAAASAVVRSARRSRRTATPRG